MSISKDRVRKAFDEFYSQDMLFELFNIYFKKWIASGYIGINIGLFEVSLITKNSPKTKFLDLLGECFFKEETFINIFYSLPEDVQKVFTEIAWNDRYYIRDDERDKFLKNEQKFSSNVQLKKEYLFFKYGEDFKKTEYIYLDNDIIRWYRKFLPKHRYSKINFLDKDTKNLNIFNDEESIIKNLRYYFKFFVDEKLELSSNGKLLKSSKQGMKKYCNITEYYSKSNDLDFLKTEILGLFFYLLKEEFLDKKYLSGNNLKVIINDFLNGKNIKDDSSLYSKLYLNYLKGYNSFGKSNMELSRSLETIKNILRNLSEDKEVSIENIVNYIIYNDKFIEILDIKKVLGTVYINEANYKRTKLSSYDNYKIYVMKPFIKSVLFILNAFGVIEIKLMQKNDKLYNRNYFISKYDGIKSVRLTKLGSYILDKRETYEFNIDEEGSVYIEDDRLFVTIIGEAPVRAIFLEEIGIKIAPNKYKVTFDSFLRKINNKKLLDEKIEEFKNKISNDLTDVWKEFFQELVSRVSSIKILDNYSTLKLKEDKNLISFITQDEKVSKMILKAENYHIIIENNKLKEFEEILNENGYFLM